MIGRGKFYRKGKAKAQVKGGNSSATSTNKTKQNISDFNYHLGSAKQASDYESATEFLINYIKKVYDYGNDIGSVLETLEPINTANWKPKMMFSTNENTITEKNENRQYEIEFKADYDTYSKRVQTYENNKIKAYALFWERCVKAMKNKIESRADFEKIRNDPILLLKAIKEHALNYQENRYTMSIVLDAMRTLMGTRQKENESLQDYTKRFRVARDVLKSHIGGPIVLTKIVETMKGYNEDDVEGTEKLRDKAFNQFLAYLYLDNADKAKYGT
ncbi:MAG: hypothetical protein ACRC1D_04435, partial [Culicoidibacterales bacterium]